MKALRENVIGVRMGRCNHILLFIGVVAIFIGRLLSKNNMYIDVLMMLGSYSIGIILLSEKYQRKLKKEVRDK